MKPTSAPWSSLLLLCFAALSSCSDDAAEPNGADAGGECSGHGELHDGHCDCDDGYAAEGDLMCIPVSSSGGNGGEGGGAGGNGGDDTGGDGGEGVADAAVVDAAMIDAAVADGAVTDAAVTDAAVADAAVADAAVADAAVADASAPDAPMADADAGDGGAECSAQLDILPAQERWTAYVVDDGLGMYRLWAKRGDDTPVLLSEVYGALSDLRWSPDGNWLAFVEKVNDWVAYVYVVDFRGNEPLDPILVGDWEEVAGTPRWSPDSTRLVYAGVNGGVLPGLRLVDVSGASPSEPIAIAEDCPQGAYLTYPCLFFTQPTLLEWSPDGTHLALLTKPFFDDFGTGSAADLFLVAASPGEIGVLASPFVPSFDPARRGVAAATFAWSPDGTRVAYAGSFEDTSSIAEAYLFDLETTNGEPIKLHTDLAAPNEGAQRFRMIWGSNDQILFSSDLTTVGAPALFSVEISSVADAGLTDGGLDDAGLTDAGLSDAGLAGERVSAPALVVDTNVRSAALSPDGNSLLVVSTVGSATSGTLTVYAFDGTASNPREVAADLTGIGGGFEAASRWAPGGSLLAFVEAGNPAGSRVSMGGLLEDGEFCSVSSFLLTEPEPNWSWLESESSIVVNEPVSGVVRLAAQSAQPELLLMLDDGETLSSWSVQP